MTVGPTCRIPTGAPVLVTDATGFIGSPLVCILATSRLAYPACPA